MTQEINPIYPAFRQVANVGIGAKGFPYVISSDAILLRWLRSMIELVGMGDIGPAFLAACIEEEENNNGSR